MKEKMVQILNQISSSKKLQFWLFTVLLLGLSLSMIYFYMSENKVYLGYDVYFHYRRLSSLMDALKNDSYPIYLDYSAAMEFGYATKWFYPDFMLLPFALIGNLTNSILAYKTMIFCFTFLCGIITFKTSQKIFNNSFISTASALLYTFALYRMFNLFYRSAIAEGVAMAFIPLVFWGLYEIIQGNYKKWYILAIGYSLLLMTHLLTSVMMFMTIIIILIICHKYITKEPKRLYYLIIAGISTIAISAIYLFPMLEQMLSNTFRYSIPHPSTWPQNNELSILRIVWGMFNGLNLEEVNQFPSIGIILTAAVASRFFLAKKTEEVKKIDTIFFLGLFYVFITSNLFPWEVFPFNKIKFFQFPTRFFLFTSYFFAISGAFYLQKTIQSAFKKYFCIFIITLATIFTMVMNGREFQNAAFFKESGLFEPIPNEKNYYHLGSLEYIPIQFPSLEYIKKRAKIIKTKYSNTEISDIQRHYDTTTFNANIKSDEEILEIPRFYYKGYIAGLNGKNIPLRQSSEGLVEMNIKESGKVTLVYSGTFIQKSSPFITIIGIIFLFVYIYQYKKKEDA